MCKPLSRSDLMNEIICQRYYNIFSVLVLKDALMGCGIIKQAALRFCKYAVQEISAEGGFLHG